MEVAPVVAEAGEAGGGVFGVAMAAFHVFRQLGDQVRHFATVPVEIDGRRYALRVVEND
jgi:hypothetical protein